MRKAKERKWLTHNARPMIADPEVLNAEMVTRSDGAITSRPKRCVSGYLGGAASGNCSQAAPSYL